MQTEIIMHRDFSGYSIRQFSQSGMLNATDLTAAFNARQIENGEQVKRIEPYLRLKATQAYIRALCKKLNIKEKKVYSNRCISSDNELKSIAKIAPWTPKNIMVTKRGKDNAGVWMNDYLYTDYALWLSPELKVEVLTWLTDNLLYTRNESGTTYMQMKAALVAHFYDKQGMTTVPGIYGEPSKAICVRVFGHYDDTINQWNFATKAQLQQRIDLMNRIVTMLEFGNFESVEAMIARL